ncbi:hypothetical protein ACD661_05015 [Legionella lytica]|uniref:Uncharacterized protein n=1 Tax=Legionella lytica TaxID=96232 RepID=A0ABW8D5F9_9GAMM
MARHIHIEEREKAKSQGRSVPVFDFDSHCIWQYILQVGEYPYEQTLVDYYKSHKDFTEKYKEFFEKTLNKDKTLDNDIKQSSHGFFLTSSLKPQDKTPASTINFTM